MPTVRTALTSGGKRKDMRGNVLPRFTPFNHIRFIPKRATVLVKPFTLFPFKDTLGAVVAARQVEVTFETIPKLIERQ